MNLEMDNLMQGNSKLLFHLLDFSLNYDVDGSGSINYEEFARGMRDELAGRRLAMTKKAFIMMDRDKSGVITKEDLIGIYDVSKNPYFINRQKTKDEILNEFLSNFDG